MSLAMLLDSEVSAQVKTNWMQFATIVAAISAALIALFGVQRQIHQQAELEEQRRTRSLAASKASLPLALARFSGVTDKGISFSIESDEFYADANNISVLNEALEIGDNTIAVMKECIEFSDEQSRRWISVLLVHYQIALARLVGRCGDPNLWIMDANRESSVVDWLTIKALTDHLYRFARGVDESVACHLDLDLIRMPLHHPAYNSAIHAQAVKTISQNRARYSNGSVQHFELTDQSKP